jgi:hypothetical protein
LTVSRIRDQVPRWLLDGDPAIRWQVLRDVVGAAASTVERARQTVAREGWGARLLALQDPEGTWAGGLSSDGGLYSPKWTSTTYTMLLLRDFGLSAKNRQAQKACKLLLDAGLQRDGGINYGTWARWQGQSETCVTGMALSILRLSFPPRWHYDILRALDYFQAVKAPRDQRLAEAIDIVRSKQCEDGCWPLENVYRGKTYFELERPGAPSRWNTLRALRVLKWWNADARRDES